MRDYLLLFIEKQSFEKGGIGVATPTRKLGDHKKWLNPFFMHTKVKLALI